jgi:hypothetical protein
VGTEVGLDGQAVRNFPIKINGDDRFDVDD